MIRILLSLATVLVFSIFPTMSPAEPDASPFSLNDHSGGGPAHPEIGTHEALVKEYDNGLLTLHDLRRLGLSVFVTPFNTYDGLGDGPFDASELNTRLPGQRPTLQGNGLSLRVNGLDAQSCNECHTMVSSTTRPPTLGIAGVGGIVQNALIMPTMVDMADSQDDRITWPSTVPGLPFGFDGVADYNGRFANPPFLFGGGGVELLGKEMTVDLQGFLKIAEESLPHKKVSLLTHGVYFGYLVSEGDGKVDFDNIEGIDKDLVIKPFGRKGEKFSMRDFDREAMQFHFGIQPVEVVGEDIDQDGDGVSNEVTIGEMTALHIFDVSNPRPVQRTSSEISDDGFTLFRKIGCTNCHVPSLETRERTLPLAFPEVPNDPYANVYIRVDLVDIGFDSSNDGGVKVPLFADLKRHDMGDLLAETFEHGQISNREFTTARLWGVADTAPYLHDGRATTLYQAVWFHGGEAQGPRDRFINKLTESQQQTLLEFLMTLRTPRKPNEDLLPLE